MKVIFGLLLVLLGLALAVYVGGYLCLYCGACDAVDAFKMNPIPTKQLVWGILRVIPLAEIVGGVIFWIFVFTGYTFIRS